MSTPIFRYLPPGDFKRFHPRNEDEALAYGEESMFRDWCEENEEDPMDPDARSRYNEIQGELGDKGWSIMDRNDREGWEHNMNKD